MEANTNKQAVVATTRRNLTAFEKQTRQSADSS
jgi:hypothetical protein